MAVSPEEMGIDLIKIIAHQDNKDSTGAIALIEAGADLTVYSALRTALGWAAENGKTDILQTLIAHGAEVEAPCMLNGFTPLMDASSQGHVECIQLLLQNKADVNAHEAGHTPLVLAIEKRSGSAVECLIAAGAKVNVNVANGWTPLMYAAFEYSSCLRREKKEEAMSALAIMRALVDAGANHLAANNAGGTAGMIAGDASIISGFVMEREERKRAAEKLAADVAAEKAATEEAMRAARLAPLSAHPMLKLKGR